MPLPREKLNRLVERFETIQAELNSGSAHGDPAPLGTAASAKRGSQATYAKLTKEFSELSPLVAAINAYYAADKEARDLTAMMDDPGADREMKAMAYDELDALKPQIAALEKKLEIELLPKDSADSRSAILEVRAGTGGDEAALFAADLFRMYQRYAEQIGRAHV